MAGASGNGEPGVDRPDKFLTGKAILIVHYNCSSLRTFNMILKLFAPTHRI